jgi:hypothetical protein
MAASTGAAGTKQPGQQHDDIFASATQLLRGIWTRKGELGVRVNHEHIEPGGVKNHPRAQQAHLRSPKVTTASRKNSHGDRKRKFQRHPVRQRDRHHGVKPLFSGLHGVSSVLHGHGFHARIEILRLSQKLPPLMHWQLHPIATNPSLRSRGLSAHQGSMPSGASDLSLSLSIWGVASDE